MKTLVLGAGGTGGYFGGRLVESGADVSFLVRPRRAELLKQTGLVVKSQVGDIHVKSPRLITEPDRTYDLVILSCKAYDLQNSMHSIAAAVAKNTTILPLLNGMDHIEKLIERFGSEPIIGGLCIISSTIDESGAILHLNDTHTLKFGELNAQMTPRVKQIADLFKPANFLSIASEDIKKDMWEKWVMISTLAALTTLMRASLGQIARSPGGINISEQLLEECLSIVRAHNHEPSAKFIESTHSRMVDPSSTLTASMLRDLENNRQVEADQIIGDLIARAEAKNIAVPILRIAYCHLKSYELRRDASVPDSAKNTLAVPG